MSQELLSIRLGWSRYAHDLLPPAWIPINKGVRLFHEESQPFPHGGDCLLTRVRSQNDARCSCNSKRLLVAPSRERELKPRRWNF